MANNSIAIAGVRLDPNKFPKLYYFAKTNPAGLEELLRSLAQASGGDQADLTQDATNLEHDLQHG